MPNPMNPQTLNRYSYCLNNPLKYIDPSGHFPAEEIFRRIWEGRGGEGGGGGGGGGGGNSQPDKPDLPGAHSPPVDTTGPKPSEPDDFNNMPLYGPPLPENYDYSVYDNSLVVAAASVSTVIVSDDITVVGIVDDVIIPAVWIGCGVAWIVVNSEAIATDITNIWNYFAHRKTQESEHTKDRGSTWDQHSKKRPGAPEKKDQKPNWKQR